MTKTYMMTLDELLTEQVSLRNRMGFLKKTTTEYRVAARRFKQVRTEILVRNNITV